MFFCLTTLGVVQLLLYIVSILIASLNNKLKTEARKANFYQTTRRHTKKIIFFNLYFYLVSLGGVRLSPLGTSATVGLLYQLRMIDDDDYGAVGGMSFGRRNRSARRKPAPMPHCPQIPHDMTWDRTRAAAVESQRLTA
jgi:hypothetical protein